MAIVKNNGVGRIIEVIYCFADICAGCGVNGSLGYLAVSNYIALYVLLMPELQLPNKIILGQEPLSGVTGTISW